MAVQIGRLDEYNDAKEDFESYLERTEQWVRANEIRDEKKVCAFLSVIGADAYRLLNNLVSPTVPSAMTYPELVRALSTHYKPAAKKINGVFGTQ